MPNPKDRAGRYETQSGGYRAFFPRELPPDPAIDLADLQSRLSLADIALGRLDGSIRTLPNPDLFVLMYVRKEAVLSSQIEGTQSSLQDLLAAEAEIFDPAAPRDVAEVVNYVAAMKYGLERLQTLPLSVRLIREIHAKLLNGVRGANLTPGDLRRSQNWIGPSGCTIRTATFVPPPHHYVPQALGALERFLHEGEGLPLLIRIGLAHAQFETIHPFLDGNGRVGRLLITFLLCHEGVLGQPVLYLSHFFKQHRQRYYELLQGVRDDGNWESWLLFFLEGVEQVSRQATETAHRVLRLRETHREAIAGSLGYSAGNGHRVLEKLYRNPIMSVNQVRELTGTTYPAANQLVEKLVRLDILSEITGQARHRRFSYKDYIRLFQDADGEIIS